MQTTRKRRRVLAAVAVAAACAVGTPVALGVTGDSGGGGYSGDVGDAKVEAARAAQGRGRAGAAPGAVPAHRRGREHGASSRTCQSTSARTSSWPATTPTSAPTAPAPAGTPPIGTPPPGNCTPGTGGLTVIDISDPEHPERVGLFDCAGGQNDVQLSPDGKWAAMAIESRNNACHPGEEGSVVLSLADPENPVEVSFLPIRTRPATLVGSHNHTLDWPYLYIDQYVATLQPDRHLRPDRPGQPR